ncbi:MAG: endonuclease III, partial [Opitutae bacterium]|nr:endonuclease III [Opitutae bacterium]
MLKKQRAKFIQERLEELYPNPAIPLLHKDSYTLLVAVLLSAQCTDERVNKVTPALFDLADDPASMARLSIEAIDNAVRSCGLSPRKAKAISEMSQILELEHGGQVPA